MIIVIFIKIIFNSCFVSIKRKFNISKLSKNNSTCRFDNTCHIQLCEFEKYVVIFENSKLYSAKIGAYSYIQAGSRIFNCEIGRFCSIASGVTIAPGLHEMNRISTHPIFVQKSTPLPKVYASTDYVTNHKKVRIGNDVWIGEKAVILDGINVGDGAVIASGAIVIHDVEPYSVVGGVPARHIKYRFDEHTIMSLQSSKWWNYSEEWFEKNAELMLDIVKFKESLECI